MQETRHRHEKNHLRFRVFNCLTNIVTKNHWSFSKETVCKAKAVTFEQLLFSNSWRGIHKWTLLSISAAMRFYKANLCCKIILWHRPDQIFLLIKQLDYLSYCLRRNDVRRGWPLTLFKNYSVKQLTQAISLVFARRILTSKLSLWMNENKCKQWLRMSGGIERNSSVKPEQVKFLEPKQLSLRNISHFDATVPFPDKACVSCFKMNKTLKSVGYQWSQTHKPTKLIHHFWFHREVQLQ